MPEPVAEPAVNPKRVLIVEDDPTMRDMMRDMLDFDGYEVATADRGTRVLEIIDLWQPCLLILDIMMPGVDGMQILREIVERDLPVKVLVATAYMPDEVLVDEHEIMVTRESFQALGAWELLIKPFEMQTLLDLAAEACGAPTE